MPKVLRAAVIAEAGKGRKGYALKDDARANSAGETLWCSPHCVPLVENAGLFAEAAE